jgi:hypothetical protein
MKYYYNMKDVFYLNLNSSYLYYQEGNKHYLCSNSSSRKIKEYLKYVLFINENEITKKIGLFSYRKKEYKHVYLYFVNSLIESKKRKFFKETFYENKARIKIIGRGWKIVKYPYELLIKLGYSHSIFFLMDPYIKYKLKKKKKKYYTFYGTSYDKLNTIMGKFNFMRIPDTYTRKGIFHRKIVL